MFDKLHTLIYQRSKINAIIKYDSMKLAMNKIKGCGIWGAGYMKTYALMILVIEIFHWLSKETRIFKIRQYFDEVSIIYAGQQ